MKGDSVNIAILSFLSCPGSSIPTLVVTHSLTDCHFRIWTQRVTFETQDFSDIWPVWCLDKKTKRQKDKKTKRQKDEKMNRQKDKKKIKQKDEHTKWWDIWWDKIWFLDLSKGISSTLHFSLETSLFCTRHNRSLKSRNSLYQAPIHLNFRLDVAFWGYKSQCRWMQPVLGYTW